MLNCNAAQFRLDNSETNASENEPCTDTHSNIVKTGTGRSIYIADVESPSTFCVSGLFVECTKRLFAQFLVLRGKAVAFENLIDMIAYESCRKQLRPHACNKS